MVLDPELNHSDWKDCIKRAEPELYQGDVEREKRKLILQYLHNRIHISAFHCWMSRDQINLAIIMVRVWLTWEFQKWMD